MQLSDAATGTVLDTETITSFHGGEYLDWKVGGNLLITVSHVSGSSAILNGLFLDPAQASSAATFQADDVDGGGPITGFTADTLSIPTKPSVMTPAISQIQLAGGNSGESGPVVGVSQDGTHAVDKTHKNTRHPHPFGHDSNTTKDRPKATVFQSSGKIRSHLLLRRRLI